jgi:hypothetical protein
METKIYYESKLKDYTILFLAVMFAGLISYATHGLGVYFLGIAIVAGVVSYFYKGSILIISPDKFIWKKGNKQIECPWSDVVAIHFDHEISITTLQKNFKGYMFFIETKAGFTSRIDLVAMRAKGHPLTLSKGQELLDLIKSKSEATERIGEVSAFKQTEKLRGMTFLVIAIFAVPILIFLYYSVFAGCNILSSLCI